MQFQDTDIALSQRNAVEEIRRATGHALSSHAFVSLFLWQEQMGLRLRLFNAAYTVRRRCASPSYFFPCGDMDAVREFIGALAPGSELCYLRPQDAAYLEREFAGQFWITRQPEADEYLYDIAGHLALCGGEYANMRTQVHKVERDFQVRSEAICARNAPDALQIIREWTHGAHRFAGCDLRDDEVDVTAIEHLSELGMEGTITYLNGCPGAVVAGFPLTQDTFDIVVAKCAQNYQGVSYYSKRELMKQVGDRFARINLEEDLGLEGLRRMKRGLHPTGMNFIWRAVRK